jgi:hypothetical protein
MATNPTQIETSEGDKSTVLVTWNLTTAAPDGEPIEMSQWADRTFQADFTTVGGAILTIEGSNNRTKWAPLSNAAGAAALTFSADGMKSSIELPRWVRPNLTTVGAGAVVAVTMMARRQQPLRV